MSEDDRRALEAMVTERAEAVERQDREVLVARIGDDVLDFGVLPPAATRGSAAIAEGTAAWFDGYADGPHYEPRVLQAEAAGDLGYVAYAYHVTGTLTSGDEVDMWVRSTLVCRRAASGWQVVHSHESVPFDAETGQALIGERVPSGL